MRTFIAVDIPANEKIIEINRLLAEKIKGAIIKLTDPAQIHITLAFLGELSAEQISELHSGLSEIKSGVSEIILNLEKVGIFMHNNQPGVIWIGIEVNPYLTELWNNINICIQKSVIQTEQRTKFSPHITLGRVKYIQNSNNLLEIIDRYKNSNFGIVKLEKFTFYKSILTAEGPIYKSLYIYKFK